MHCWSYGIERQYHSESLLLCWLHAEQAMG